MAKMKIKTKAEIALEKALEQRKKKKSNTTGIKLQVNHKTPKKKEEK